MGVLSLSSTQRSNQRIDSVYRCWGEVGRFKWSTQALSEAAQTKHVGADAHSLPQIVAHHVVVPGPSAIDGINLAVEAKVSGVRH